MLCSSLFLGNSRPKSTKNVADFLRTALSTWPAWTLPKVADQIGLNKSYLSHWKNGVHLPSFGAVVLLAEAFNCSLESVLTGDATGAQEPIQIEPTQKTPRGKTVNAKDIILQMKACPETAPPLSLTELGKRLGIDSSTIRKRFPVLAKTIVAKRNRIRKELSVRIHLERAKAYQAAANHLAMKGLRPTQRRIWEILGSKYGFFNPIDRQSCRQACREAILVMRKIS
jgi:transcriptional regulator with XRE-family HTH domain